MEKKFIAINYQVVNSTNEYILNRAIQMLASFMIQSTQYPYNFKIYSGIGMRGEEGVWLEFNTKEINGTEE